MEKKSSKKGDKVFVAKLCLHYSPCPLQNLVLFHSIEMTTVGYSPGLCEWILPNVLFFSFSPAFFSILTPICANLYCYYSKLCFDVNILFQEHPLLFHLHASINAVELLLSVVLCCAIFSFISFTPEKGWIIFLAILLIALIWSSQISDLR